MGAIVDASVSDQVFGSNRTEAGVKFFNWINPEICILITGGKAFRELCKTSANELIQELIFSGKMRKEDEQEVDALTAKLENEGGFISDDPHILALAQVSGARLLYSNDKKLHKDFKNKKLIDNPQGKSYSTIRGGGFKDSHKNLLRLKRKDLCATPL